MGQTIDELTEQVLTAVLTTGVPPEQAAAKIADPSVLSPDELETCVRETVGRRVNVLLSRHRRRDLEEEMKDRDDALAKLLAAADVLARVFYSDADGTERSLMHLTLEGYRRWLAKTTTMLGEAAKRKGYFAAAVDALERHQVDTIGVLPLKDQAALRQKAVEVWG